MAHFAIGIDIGGGSTKIGLVAGTGKIVDKERLIIDKAATAENIVQNYADAIRRLCARNHLAKLIGIGIGFPGFIYPDHLVGTVGNIPALDDYPLAENLSCLFACPARMENDATAACLAESLYGQRRAVRRLMLVSAGTGIGVAMTIDGRPLVSAGGCLGDAGHLIVNLDEPRPCRQGCLGCLESVASGHAVSEQILTYVRDNPYSALAHHIRALKKQPDASDVIDCAHQGDEQSINILRQVGTWLGQAAASWCHIFAPDEILLGGGLSAAGSLLLEPMEKEARRRGMKAHLNHVGFSLASLGNDAGMIGAAAQIFLELK